MEDGPQTATPTWRLGADDRARIRAGRSAWPRRHWTSSVAADAVADAVAEPAADEAERTFLVTARRRVVVVVDTIWGGIGHRLGCLARGMQQHRDARQTAVVVSANGPQRVDKPRAQRRVAAGHDGQQRLRARRPLLLPLLLPSHDPVLDQAQRKPGAGATGHHERLVKALVPAVGDAAVGALDEQRDRPARALAGHGGEPAGQAATGPDVEDGVAVARDGADGKGVRRQGVEDAAARHKAEVQVLAGPPDEGGRGRGRVGGGDGDPEGVRRDGVEGGGAQAVGQVGAGDGPEQRGQVEGDGGDDVVPGGQGVVAVEEEKDEKDEDERKVQALEDLVGAVPDQRQRQERQARLRQERDHARQPLGAAVPVGLEGARHGGVVDDERKRVQQRQHKHAPGGHEVEDDELLGGDAGRGRHQVGLAAKDQDEGQAAHGQVARARGQRRRVAVVGVGAVGPVVGLRAERAAGEERSAGGPQQADADRRAVPLQDGKARGVGVGQRPHGGEDAQPGPAAADGRRQEAAEQVAQDEDGNGGHKEVDGGAAVDEVGNVPVDPAAGFIAASYGNRLECDPATDGE
ncbi:hypothetical protein SPBR_06748 [Sporothrix brasiliensis 5110]|uniref:Uncharacterized protein n=1 Tax=Sporothrix brasiliensis 5110 TaxID=1398154 RepID=A0A0C2ETB5_9PEZI|nr:uncharacterized protein SPBR_06748 [Sporothrix brasiliensis 5110]KIH89689.1 hypothetical protein SPBR_06748 [Sporothrix brasiliensis 5110]